MITITGLNAKQKALCDIMWGLEEYAAVEAFIATLPRPERLECRTLIQMMLAAFVDEITTVDEAKEVLDQFRI
ncbi:MAG: hypothetical protein EBW68_04885 [Actinobacteria bacterium]|jgi:hypothetical protein|nr:hypothetical protein [Actinomycetota bacterium]